MGDPTDIRAGAEAGEFGLFQFPVMVLHGMNLAALVEQRGASLVRCVNNEAGERSHKPRSVRIVEGDARAALDVYLRRHPKAGDVPLLPQTPNRTSHAEKFSPAAGLPVPRNSPRTGPDNAASLPKGRHLHRSPAFRIKPTLQLRRGQKHIGFGAPEGAKSLMNEQKAHGREGGR